MDLRSAIVSANHTASYGERVLVDASGGNRTVTLPPATFGQRGIEVIKTDATANTVTIACAGSDLLDGAASQVLTTQGMALGLVAFEATWLRVSQVLTRPGAPTIGTATAGVLSASVPFTAGGTGGSAVTSYTATSSPGGITGTGTSSPIVVSGLSAGTAYTFTVTAASALGTSPATAASNSVTPSASPSAPGVPTIGTATAGNTTATANWTAPTSDGGSAITGYTVKTYDSSGSLLATDTVGAVLTLTKTGLTNGTGVKFKVQATNAIGTGTLTGFSNTVTPSAPFDPSTVAGLETWLEADALALTNGDPVSSWTDQSSHARPAISAGTNRPSFVTAALNGYPIVRFGGTHYLQQATFSLIAQPLTRFTVVKTLATGTQPIADGTDFGGAVREVVWSDNGTYKWYAVGGVVNGQATDAAWHIIVTVWNGASSVIRKDGGAGLTGNPGSAGFEGLTLGAFADLSSRGTDDMAAVLVYSGALSSADINAVGNYLATKYGLAWVTVP